MRLADYQTEKPQPGDSAWAELRETQTKTPQDGLPVTPFRTDSFDLTTKPKPAVAAK